MGAYKAATMKRHIAWSNCKSVECLNLGVMTREMQRRLFAHAPKSAKSYKSRDGKTSYVGTKFLKHTQILVLVFNGAPFLGIIVYLFVFQPRKVHSLHMVVIHNSWLPEDLSTSIWITVGPSLSPLLPEEGGPPSVK
jgi:hypothetical protein